MAAFTGSKGTLDDKSYIYNYVGVELQINESCEHTYRMVHTFLAQDTDTQWLGVSGGHKVTYTFFWWTFGFLDAADFLNVYVGVDR